MDVVLSGMRPTGKLHIGHLKGVLDNWVELQDIYRCYFFVADWHALTTEYDNSSGVSDFSVEMVAEWLSVGIDPAKSILFVQSHVKEHAELFLLLSMVIPVTWLERVPSYKDMKEQLSGKDLNTYGFLGYPLLQAADIMIYKTNVVPVGEDQVPHVELTREVARRFNYIFKKNVFVEPKELVNVAARVKGLDGRKMSKSFNNAIYLSDSPDIVKKKVFNAVTDPARIHKNDPGHPDICNIFHYHKLFTTESEVNQIEEDCKKGNIGCFACKNNLYDKIESELSPIRDKREKFIADKSFLYDIIKEGNKKAKEQAEKTIIETREAVGLYK